MSTIIVWEFGDSIHYADGLIANGILVLAAIGVVSIVAMVIGLFAWSLWVGSRIGREEPVHDDA